MPVHIVSFTDSGDTIEFRGFGNDDVITVTFFSKFFPNLRVYYGLNETETKRLIDFLQAQLNHHTTNKQ